MMNATNVQDVQISVPLAETREETLIGSIKLDLQPCLRGRFQRLVHGLQSTHATFELPGGRTMHVDSAADAIRWLISQLPE